MEFSIGLALIIGFGTLAQWLAWRVNLPSILLLLLFGFVLGPVTGWLNPDLLFGEVLFPLVSVSVAIILFEGGLSLRFSDLRGVGGVIKNLVTQGVALTWAMTSAAVFFILKVELSLALLLGAILVVTGPTVIGPLMRHMKPKGEVGSILKWEGIMIDPIGAMLAVLVFEALFVAHGFGEALGVTVLILLKTVAVGCFVGFSGALFMFLMLKRFWLPDFLQSPVTLMTLVVALTVSNYFQEESGLLAATVMGIALANFKSVNVKHIVEFKENLRVLLISSLFVILAARLQIQDFRYIDANAFVFLAVLILFIRPVVVLVSTWGSKLHWKEKVFLSWMAPRGIVAAAVASVFSFELAAQGYEEAKQIVPLTFMVIIGTVSIYGLTAPFLARVLGIANPNPQGVLMVGAHPWARAIARSLEKAGFRVVLIDTNYANVAASRVVKLSCVEGNILSQSLANELDLEGVGRLMALTTNEEINALSTIRFAEIFGRSQVYQLVTQSREESSNEEEASQHLGGRFLFSDEAHFAHISRLFSEGATVEHIPLTGDFDLNVFKQHYGERALPLFLVTPSKELVVFTTDKNVTPKSAQTLICFMRPKMA